MTRLAHSSANEIDRALISMVARSNTPLQSEAGYIDARPKTRSTKLLATHGRTIHAGQVRQLTDVQSWSARTPIATVKADALALRLHAINSGHVLSTRCGKFKLEAHATKDCRRSSDPQSGCRAGLSPAQCAFERCTRYSNSLKFCKIWPLAAVPRTTA